MASSSDRIWAWNYTTKINERLKAMLHANDTIILWIAQGSDAEQAGLKGANATSYGDLIPGDAIVATDGKPKKGQFMCFLQTERLTFHNFLDT